MKSFKSCLNYQQTVGEINNDPSMTVPDQAMSMREILNRFARGLPLGGAKVELWDEEDDLPDIRTLDLVERAELAERYQQEIREIRQAQKTTPTPTPTPAPAPPTPPPPTTAPPAEAP